MGLKLPLPSSHRGPPANLAQITKPSSLYPLLTSGDAQFKLPPLNQMYRGGSPPSPARSAASPVQSPREAPRALAARASGSRSPESEELSSGMGRIELQHQATRSPSLEERKRHADTILNLLVTINQDFKKRYPERLAASARAWQHEYERDAEVKAESPRDVEMMAV